MSVQRFNFGTFDKMLQVFTSTSSGKKGGGGINNRANVAEVIPPFSIFCLSLASIFACVDVIVSTSSFSRMINFEKVQDEEKRSEKDLWIYFFRFFLLYFYTRLLADFSLRADIHLKKSPIFL